MSKTLLEDPLEDNAFWEIRSGLNQVLYAPI